MGLSGWVRLALESAITGMNFLSERSREKLRKDYLDVLEDYRREQDNRTPHYNDARLIKARERKRDFILAVQMAAKKEQAQ
jgi:hypothetical protein